MEHVISLFNIAIKLAYLILNEIINFNNIFNCSFVAYFFNLNCFHNAIIRINLYYFEFINLFDCC